ncbi:alpha-ketoacid dehydrogenase subunit beta [Conexibacter woesei]|uniref:Transketolase domain protein n=1 Tax=Conexibacter woesei (strain DSM 14684 / CCUG 47730 / CIP 108061 / JCM 11494 / NBRC 100937 / ID131577) TaxID=469383 RepID=D3F9V5_CONWI|nr:transketolase C-terminal domain-containing protein [Conexibacter woesei]ADB51167.1 Transketolase domain protein [Conexibacter woesei DSM 14684]
MSSRTLTLSQAFAEGVAEEMERDPAVFVVGTDLFIRGGHWAQVKGLGEKFGRERIRDAPISEAAMVASGVGAALNGMRPIVDLNFIDFVFGAIDEVVNQAAKIRYMWDVPVPVVIRGTAGVAFGAAQHNNQVEAWFAHMPGLFVATPSTPWDAKGLIKSALRGSDPVVFLMHKMQTGLRGEAGGPDDLVPYGRAAVRRGGADVTIVGYSIMATKALEAARRLEAEGIDAEVIDLRTVFPLDLETVVASVRKTGRLVVAGESTRIGGIASEVAAAIQEACFDDLDAPIERVGALHVPIPHSPALFKALIPDVADVERAARTVLYREQPTEVPA